MPVDQRGARAAAFAATLGLHPEFCADVSRRGQKAIVDRAQMVDGTGAMGITLLMVRELGGLMKDGMLSGKGMIPPEALIKAVDGLSRKYKVPPSVGHYILGTVFDVFKQTASRTEEGIANGNDMAADTRNDETAGRGTASPAGSMAP